MGIFSSLFRKNEILADTICFDNNEYLIWKWCSDDNSASSQTRECIPFGYPIRVVDGEVAIFHYFYKAELKEKFIVGPFEEVLKPSHLDLKGNFEENNPIEGKLFFVNQKKVYSFNFGVPYFLVNDRKNDDISLPVSVRGTIFFNINDYLDFISIHGFKNFSVDEFRMAIRDFLNQYIKKAIQSIFDQGSTSLLQIESMGSEISEEIEFTLYQRARERFGIMIKDISIAGITIDKNSDGYKQLVNQNRV